MRSRPVSCRSFIPSRDSPHRVHMFMVISQERDSYARKHLEIERKSRNICRQALGPYAYSHGSADYESEVSWHCFSFLYHHQIQEFLTVLDIRWPLASHSTVLSLSLSISIPYPRAMKKEQCTITWVAVLLLQCAAVRVSLSDFVDGITITD